MFPIFRSTFPFSCRKSRCLVGNYRYYNWMHGILKIRQILYPRKTSHVSCGLVSFCLGGGGGPQVPMWVIPSHGQWLIITIPVFLGRRSCHGYGSKLWIPPKNGSTLNSAIVHSYPMFERHRPSSIAPETLTWRTTTLCWCGMWTCIGPVAQGQGWKSARLIYKLTWSSMVAVKLQYNNPKKI